MAEIITVPSVSVGSFCAIYKDNAASILTNPHYHDSYEIDFYLNLNANIEVFVKDKRYTIHDGDLIFINEFDIHRIIYENSTSAYYRYIINFKKDYLMPNLKSAGAEGIFNHLKDCPFTCVSTSLKTRAEMEVLFKSLIKVTNAHYSDEDKCFQTAALKSYLTLILIRFWQLLKNNRAETGISKREKLVQRIIQFIDENYMEDVSLGSLEKSFFTDKFHIGHIFKDITGFSVMEYVQHRRVLEAQKMLKNTNDEIIEVYPKCGFNNTQNFYRVFKKITGITPNKYRKT